MDLRRHKVHLRRYQIITTGNDGQIQHFHFHWNSIYGQTSSAEQVRMFILTYMGTNLSFEFFLVAPSKTEVVLEQCAS